MKTDAPTPAPETDELEKLLAAATPGPWRVDGPPWNQIIWSDAENRICFMAHSSGLHEDRDIATARLIALTPTLAADLIRLRAEVATLRASEARMREALALASNRLHRCSVDYDTGTHEFIETGEWAAEARAALQGETK